MRELKFRLRVDNRVVGYERWYSGDKKFFVVDTPCWLYSEDGKRWSPMYILHNQKDQYIDFFDKNGKEIYKGDIVKDEHDSKFEIQFGLTKIIGIHRYFEGENDIVEECVDGDDFLWGDLEIIGNRYETPDCWRN